MAKRAGGVRWKELFGQFYVLTASGYAACNITEDGVLVERENVAAALEHLDGRNIIFMAKDQYAGGYQDKPGDATNA